MSELSILIRKQIVAKEDPDYYRVRNYVRKNKNAFHAILDRFGWSFRITPEFIHICKHRQDPIYSLPPVGIPSFKDVYDYFLFVFVLSYLSSRGSGCFFAFEELLGYISALILNESPDIDIDSKRGVYSFYRVILYLEDHVYLVRIDGDPGDILHDGIRDVGLLYRITGAYKSFEIHKEDVAERSVPINIYRTLYSMPFASFDRNEIDYIRKNRDEIEDVFCEIFDEDVSLVICGSMAYINHNEGSYFPNENSRKDWLILRVNGFLRKYMGKRIDLGLFDEMLSTVRCEDGVFWTKEMSLWSERQYRAFVNDRMTSLGFLVPVDGSYYVSPMVGEICIVN